MKHCTYCGKEYPDEVNWCPVDGNPVRQEGAPPAAPPLPPATRSGDTMSAAEQRFWERLPSRQLAILFVRVQAVWMLFYAAFDALTYLPRYLPSPSALSTYSPLYKQLDSGFYLELLRILIYVAAGFALIRYAEKVLRWLMKDLFPKPPPGEQPSPTTSTPAAGSSRD